MLTNTFGSFYVGSDNEGIELQTLPRYQTLNRSSSPNHPHHPQPQRPVLTQLVNERLWDGSIYSGKATLNAVPEGKGKMIFPNGNIFTGDLKNGQIDEGRLDLPSKEYYKGNFRNNKIWHGESGNQRLVLAYYEKGEIVPCCSCFFL